MSQIYENIKEELNTTISRIKITSEGYVGAKFVDDIVNMFVKDMGNVHTTTYNKIMNFTTEKFLNQENSKEFILYDFPNNLQQLTRTEMTKSIVNGIETFFSDFDYGFSNLIDVYKRAGVNNVEASIHSLKNEIGNIIENRMTDLVDSTSSSIKNSIAPIIDELGQHYINQQQKDTNEQSNI